LTFYRFAKFFGGFRHRDCFDPRHAPNHIRKDSQVSFC
jgi:hypothetical protein